ncbi:hypothetical protein CXB51_005806 [Gossypium anomalum]|uniref:Uncharacterized protein n=1 Tax=Gossypium anomalum TaxID=47600 RepID=A0A8J5Z2X8_9ROSI|nr:hypothetical protein CXB51_005806 [Gossypium anomalum]
MAAESFYDQPAFVLSRDRRSILFTINHGYSLSYIEMQRKKTMGLRSNFNDIVISVFPPTCDFYKVLWKFKEGNGLRAFEMHKPLEDGRFHFASNGI